MKLNDWFLALLFGAVLCSPAMAPAGETNLWAFDVAPYLWVASIGAETSLPDVPPATPPGAERFNTSISAGAMITVQARYRDLGVFTDFAWLRLGTEAVNPGPAFSAVHLQSDFIHTTVAGTYDLPGWGKWQADVLAGARLWNVNETMTFNTGALPGFNANDDKTWVDPVIGADVRYNLSDRWALVSKATAGGFGVSAQIAWEAFGGAEYRFNNWCSGILGYRYLYEKYHRDGFDFDLTANGFLLGVGFHF